MTRCLRPGEQPAAVDVALAQLQALRPFETRAESAALWELARDQVVLEIGTYRGFSAILMALAGAIKVVTIDTHEGDDLVGRQETLCDAWRNVGLHQVQERVTLIVGRSSHVLPYLRPATFGLIFVDGDHHAAELDTELAWPLLRRPGHMIWHDREHWSVPRGIQRGRALAREFTYRELGQLAIMRVE